MEEQFYKFRFTTDIATIKTNLPVITLPVKENVSKPISVLNNSWVLGISLIFLMLFLLITMIISGQHTKHSATQSALVSQLQIHHLLLPKTVQQALSDNVTAIAQLQDNQHRFDQFFILLSQGGIYQQTKMTPPSDHLRSSNLLAFLKPAT